MTPERLEEIKLTWLSFLGKSWFWKFNARAKQVSLEDNRGNIVMDFVRFGMNGAKPRFNVDGIMRDADQYADTVDGREHHSEWFQTICEETAIAIASSPQHIEELIEAVESLQKEREELVGLLRWAEKRVIDTTEEPGSVQVRARIREILDGN